MIRDNKVVHPAADGSTHNTWFAAVTRTLKYNLFMGCYDGNPAKCGYSWDAVKGEKIDHHKDGK